VNSRPRITPKSRTPLVPELGLDVIEILRQRAVAAELLPCDVRDDLFACRLNDEIPLVAILEAEQFRTVLLKAPALLPQLGGCTTGISSSTAPARFISSRTIASTLRMTRNPIGM
jgi:hypothetical protein